MTEQRMDSNKKNKKRRKITLFSVIQFILICIILFCVVKIGIYFYQRYDSDKQFKSLATEVEKIRPKTGSGDDAKASISSTTDYVKFMDELKKKNKDITLWLDIDAFNTHYPVVFTGDNDFYLRRDLNRHYNVQGTLFLDGENSTKLTDQNTIIYGHMMYQGDSMFGCLKHTLEADFFKKQGNLDIKLTNEKGVYTYRVFSVYLPSVEDPYIYPNISDDDYIKFLKSTYKKSIHKIMDMPVFSKDTKILTLSTCTPNQDESHRVAVVAILIDSPKGENSGEKSN